MIVVLDTNVIIESISRRSSKNIIIQSLRNQHFQIALSTEILLE